MILINNLKVRPYIDLKVELEGIIGQKVSDLMIKKKSIDARKEVFYVFSCYFYVENEKAAFNLLKSKKYDVEIKEYEKPSLIFNKVVANNNKHIVVVGSGPAGLFAALTLCQGGCKVTLVERGDSVKNRKEKVDRFFNNGVLDTNTNVQFGAGGAGTFSDGKLATGIKSEYKDNVLYEFYVNGADESVLYDSKPHIGTDKLVTIVENFTNKLISLGCDIRFNTKLVDLIIDNNKVEKVILESNNQKEELACDFVVLAIGHSARDTFNMIKSKGFIMERKPFSMGVRIEHLQKDINESQYKKDAKHIREAADYKLSVNTKDNRGVYSFCMCPGGIVVPSSSEENTIVVNGMSNFKRERENANSAILVSVLPNDFIGEDVLGGLELQKTVEEKAFKISNSYKAPCQLVGDLIKGIPSKKLGEIKPSYSLGVTMCDLSDCLPSFVVNDLREALPLFENKIKGFSRYDATLTGVETRSSSPVRVIRNENYESSIVGVFPAGEGPGYAGGIMSAAIDGINVANAIIGKING